MFYIRAVVCGVEHHLRKMNIASYIYIILVNDKRKSLSFSWILFNIKRSAKHYCLNFYGILITFCIDFYCTKYLVRREIAVGIIYVCINVCIYVLDYFNLGQKI